MTDERPGHIRVGDAPERSRFEVQVDGELAGFADYRWEAGRVVLVHTEVDERYEGQGVGSSLARATLDELRSRGVSIVPRCRFVALYVQKHPEYADMVATGD